MLGKLKTRAAAVAAAATIGLAAAALASANSTGLDGGSSCYGTAKSNYGAGVIDARTFALGSPCNSYTQVYLEAVTPAGYADFSPSWGYTGIGFVTGAPSVQSTHNFCHTWCNGYVGTSAP